jgi:hypothetical protein
MLRIGFPTGEMFESIDKDEPDKERIISENILSRIFSLIPMYDCSKLSEEMKVNIQYFTFEMDSDLRSFMSLSENVRSMLHQHVQSIIANFVYNQFISQECIVPIPFSKTTYSYSFGYVMKCIFRGGQDQLDYFFQFSETRDAFMNGLNLWKSFISAFKKF